MIESLDQAFATYGPRRQLWTAVAFTLARKAQNFALYVCSTHKKSFECVKKIFILALERSKKIVARH
jgi:hypothetical protein